MRSPAPTPIAAAAPAGTTSGPKQSAVIGPSMTIKGEIRAREELLVEGEVEGLLESESLLTVGPNGKVLGNIKARRVAIFGSVRGNVEVTEKTAIREQGSLIGDIKGSVRPRPFNRIDDTPLPFPKKRRFRGGFGEVHVAA